MNINITQKLLGETIRELREKNYMSQEVVAKNLGLSRQAIISIESGKRKIDTFELLELVKLFRIDINELVSLAKREVDPFFKEVVRLRNTDTLTKEDEFSLNKFQEIWDNFQFLKSINND
jgi:transcriptional regulator with XRE-family HTH domain